ncbi:MAG: DUF2780 domain-containing protein [Candidatus Dadabacteria bacterium]|nr:DUF2780 domain-containing protein [Candidatus Dadabacteria bacterium]NIV41389.1 DUF2780 domain-containing protein [Candidatus Dadabacteria bacterium]NIX14596.1 DUF2780 domain-containing protein [Candidatus Dadabacteria bacterium]
MIELLIKNLGVNHTQAMGGVGLILQVAKDKLDGSDFAEIAKHITGLDDILDAAPKTGGLLGKLGGLASGLGSGGENLAVISRLGAGFSKLDLGSDMAMKFFPVIESYFREKNDEAVDAIINKVIGKMG